MSNPHFEQVTSPQAARRLLGFEPRTPRYTAGATLQSLQVHVRDHKLRELEERERTLEAHYGTFVLSQARRSTDEARRLAIETSYGREPLEVQVAGREGRLYELGPEPPPDDIDGRPPAVVTWHDEDRFYLVASAELPAQTLAAIAASLYP